MTSLYGVFEYFDYESWQRQRCIPPRADQIEYPEGTIMNYLMLYAPRFAQIVVRSKYDRRFADPQGRFTIFLSPYWETLPPDEIERIDVGTAKNIVMNSTLEGRIRRIDLVTSQDSQLNTLINGVYIHVWRDIRTDILRKDENESIEQQVDCSNGYIHLLQPLKM